MKDIRSELEEYNGHTTLRQMYTATYQKTQIKPKKDQREWRSLQRIDNRGARKKEPEKKEGSLRGDSAQQIKNYNENEHWVRKTF